MIEENKRRGRIDERGYRGHVSKALRRELESTANRGMTPEEVERWEEYERRKRLAEASKKHKEAEREKLRAKYGDDAVVFVDGDAV